MSERKHGDLISREVALNGIDKNIANLRHHAGNNCVANSAINLVQYTRDFLAALPAVDAVEVVHAKWVVKGQDVLCSHCNGESGYNAFGASSFSDYCPNCGARMDGE